MASKRISQLRHYRRQDRHDHPSSGESLSGRRSRPIFLKPLTLDRDVDAMKLTYDAPVYRPPSEARSLIIQATIGCSFDGCTFCSMYKSKDYRARPLDAVFADIATAARFWPDARRVFLADGDAVVLPTADLVRILERLAESFPRLERVSAYATPLALNAKSEGELARLRDEGLSLVYLGVESGAASILKRIRKGATPATMASALGRRGRLGSTFRRR